MSVDVKLNTTELAAAVVGPLTTYLVSIVISVALLLLTAVSRWVHSVASANSQCSFQVAAANSIQQDIKSLLDLQRVVAALTPASASAATEPSH
jgi:hypothetical protein